MGIEPMAFCVLSRCDNHYTTTTRYWYHLRGRLLLFFLRRSEKDTGSGDRTHDYLRVKQVC